MSEFDKLKAAEQHLASLGLRKFEIAPPFHRLLWRLGVAVPPPLFGSFAHLAVTNGLLFGVGWGALMWFGFFSWQRLRPPGWLFAVTAILAGVLFGLIMAWFIRRKAIKLGLPPWPEFRVPGSGA